MAGAAEWRKPLALSKNGVAMCLLSEGKTVKDGDPDTLIRQPLCERIPPLDYMLGIVRVETPSGLDASVAIARETLRFEAAKAAAPYCHPRLQAVTLGGDPENPIKVDNMSELEAARRLAFLLAKGTADAG